MSHVEISETSMRLVTATVASVRDAVAYAICSGTIMTNPRRFTVVSLEKAVCFSIAGLIECGVGRVASYRRTSGGTLELNSVDVMTVGKTGTQRPTARIAP